MASPALADINFTGGTSTDWNTGTNWDTGWVPTISDGNVFINASKTADIQTDAPIIGGVLNVQRGAELIINSNFGHASTETNQDVWLNGTITQNGGDVYFSDDTRPAGATHTMNGGTFVNRDYYRWDQASLLDIRGGSFTIGVFFNPNGKTGTLKVVGDAATSISFGKVEGFGSGTLDMVLKDGGITTIDVTNDANLPGTLNVTLDAGFTPVAGDYTLISAGSLSGSLTTVNLPDENWSLNTSATAVQLTYTPPGTSTFAITEINYASTTGMLTLTWNSKPNEIYGVYSSTDMIDWGFELDDSIPADADETTTTVTFDLNDTFPDGIPEHVYFRVEK